MKTKKILVRVLIALMALLLLALGTGTVLMTFSFLELRYACDKLSPEPIDALSSYGYEPITLEPEYASYPKGVEEITFKISDPSELPFKADYDYAIVKEGYLFQVWPTRVEGVWKPGDGLAHFCGFAGYVPDPGNPDAIYPPDETYTLKVSDWLWRPTRGTYEYITIVRVELNGVFKPFTLTCKFTIE